MSDQRRRQGAASRYLNGGASRLVSDPRDFDDAGIIGQWTQEQLTRMDADFVAEMERAFRSGKETGGVPNYPERISRPSRRLRSP
jgi:hypothetical protein